MEEQQQQQPQVTVEHVQGVTYALGEDLHGDDDDRVLPTSRQIEKTSHNLWRSLPTKGLGLEKTRTHLLSITPALNRSSRSSKFYGFVTGGALPAAIFADNIVTATDQNVQVHLPNDTIATVVEDRALRMLCELADLEPNNWPHRTFTTGATASNIVGLACAREYVVQQHAAHFTPRDEELGTHHPGRVSVAELGLIEASRKAISSGEPHIEGIHILTTAAHSSLRKAASIVGLGNCTNVGAGVGTIIDVGRKDSPHRFDLDKLESYMSQSHRLSIVVVSCAEVNTGLFATDEHDMRKIRELSDKYGAWIHIDAAFGLLARVLPDEQDYRIIRAGVAALELADSITGDAHKLLNVPYDCGFFLSKHLDHGMDVFSNPDAVYLSGSGPCGDQADDFIPSPLNIGIENSRRFRALPVYAALIDQGREGYRAMLQRQISLARSIARVLSDNSNYPKGFNLELLPPDASSSDDRALSADDCFHHIVQRTYIIVIFRLMNPGFNKYLQDLINRINKTGKIYISSTRFTGQPAARFAVANWQVNVERDIQTITQVLREQLKTFSEFLQTSP